jgi:hypothetical protein
MGYKSMTYQKCNFCHRKKKHLSKIYIDSIDYNVCDDRLCWKHANDFIEEMKKINVSQIPVHRELKGKRDH